MSLSKPMALLTERLQYLSDLLRTPLPLHGLKHDQASDLARRLLGAGFSRQFVRALSGISPRTLQRIEQTPIQRHPLRHSALPFPKKAFYPQAVHTLLWCWFSFPAMNRLDVMVQASEETGISIDEVYTFYLTHLSGPQGYLLRECTLCRRMTPRRRDESPICIVCRKDGVHARELAHRESLGFLPDIAS